MKKMGDIESKLAIIHKIYGEESIYKYGNMKVRTDLKSISSGSIKLNNLLGVGGYPRGRIVEIYGKESAGKTTACLEVISEAQKSNLACAFIDAENALDINYAKSLGVDVNNLFLSQPDYGEQALDIADKLIEANSFGVIVIDSVASLVPKSELDGDVIDQTIGLQARMMSKYLRRVSGKIRKSGTLLIFTNQVRSKIGVMFGSPDTTPGGNALKFYASIRLEMVYIGKVETGSGTNKEAVANQVKIKVVKNKVAPPFKTDVVHIRYGTGFDEESEIISEAIDKKIVKQRGAWLSIESKGEWKNIAQGKENFREKLISNHKLKQLILKRINNASEK